MPVSATAETMGTLDRPREGSSRVHEMLIVGRGGEGVVLASQLVADALVRAGLWAQSFPEFKAERRGAPIAAFVRWETQPIHRRYKVRDCDVLVCISPSAPSEDTLRSVRPGGLVVLNREARFPRAGPFALARVPASRIARDLGVVSAEGRPMGNTAVLGACAKLLLPDGLYYLEQAIVERMGTAAEPNVAAAREGHARCTRQRARRGDVPLELGAPPTAVPRPRAPVFPVSTTDSLGIHTGSWSLDRPLLTEACTSCALCALFCPEGAIARTNGSVTIDYLYCKGCGICEAVCPVRNAIRMEEVAA
jgi:2-oxoacid:acceptor oxidoreductase gamma subunit (pyruvate/2-ketoisovalerate family)/2-oxoacid:acceptor oxidoreductase delta subunit (pyruvate/2-ketoisovalerate family)